MSQLSQPLSLTSDMAHHITSYVTVSQLGVSKTIAQANATKFLWLPRPAGMFKQQNWEARGETQWDPRKVQDLTDPTTLKY
jgi:hypothetical protein